MKTLKNSAKKTTLCLGFLFFLSFTAKAYTIDSLSQSYSNSNGTLSVYFNINNPHFFDFDGISYQIQNDTLKIDVCIVEFIATVITDRDSTLKLNISQSSLPNHYIINLSNGTGCSNLVSSNYYPPNITSVLKPATQSNNILVYPNPTQAFINLVLEKEHHIAKITLYDMAGKVAKIYDATERLLDVKGINSGQYILHLQTNKGIITKKIQIE